MEKEQEEKKKPEEEKDISDFDKLFIDLLLEQQEQM